MMITWNMVVSNKNHRYSIRQFHSSQTIWNIVMLFLTIMVIFFPLPIIQLSTSSSTSTTSSMFLLRIDALTIPSISRHHHQIQQQLRPFIWTGRRRILKVQISPSTYRRNVIPSHSQPRYSTRIDMTLSSSSSSSITPTSTSTTTTSTNMNSKIISDDALRQLQHQRYVILPNFIDVPFQNELRNDIQTLREKHYFQQANIGQDNTNMYNSSIRITETCFIGKNKHRFNRMEHNPARETLYKMVDDIGAAITSSSLSSSFSNGYDTTTTSKSVILDDSLTELLYAYYPNGGYYRTHMDAIPNSISYLRQYSFLLYLNGGITTTPSTSNHNNDNNHHDPFNHPKTYHNDEWNTTIDGGQLRLYLNRNDSSNSTMRNSSNNNNNSSIDPPSTRRTLDFTNDDYKKEYDTVLDVTPTNGTLVLLDSHIIPHEVLNTYRERYVIIGWFNRQPSIFNPNDYSNILSPVIGNTGGGTTGTTTTTATLVSKERMTMLAVAVGMITFGVYNLINTL